MARINIKANAGQPERPFKPKITKQRMLEIIESCGLDEPTKEMMIKDLNSKPETAIGFYYKNIHQYIRKVRKEDGNKTNGED